MLITTVTQKGQVTIPAEIRKRLKIRGGSKMEFKASGRVIKLRKARSFFGYRGMLKREKALSSKEIEEISAGEAIKRHQKVTSFNA